MNKLACCLQLPENTDTTEKWMLSQLKTASEEYLPLIIQEIRHFGHALEKLSEGDKSNEKVEKRILLHAFIELAEMLTTVLSEMNQGRFTSCLIMLRPIQELACTITFAVEEEKLIEWYEYSIRKDIRDYKELKSMIEGEINSDLYDTCEQAEQAREVIDFYNVKLRKLRDLKTELGTNWSAKEQRHLNKKWQAGSKEIASRMKHWDKRIPFDGIIISSWMTLNGYIHARSREFSPTPTLGEVLSQLLQAIGYIAKAHQESVERSLL